MAQQDTSIDENGTILPSNVSIDNSNLKIGSLLRKENHAKVYDVCNQATNDIVQHLEARAYDLEHSSPKVKKHRKRCIKRLSVHTKFQFRYQGLHVVVVEIGSAPLSTPRDSGLEQTPAICASQAPPTLHGLCISPACDNGDMHEYTQSRAPKSACQRESARLRQLHRRRARRREEPYQATMTADDLETPGKAYHGPENWQSDEGFHICDASYMAYDDFGISRRNVTSTAAEIEGSSPIYQCVKGYLEAYSTIYSSLEIMEAYVDIQPEVAEFRRLQSRMPSVFEHYAEYARILTERTEHPSRDYEEWRQMQLEHLKMARDQLETMKHLQRILPMAVNHLESLCEKLGRNVES